MSTRREQWTFIQKIFAKEQLAEESAGPGGDGHGETVDVSQLVFRLVKAHEKEREKWKKERRELEREIAALRSSGSHSTSEGDDASEERGSVQALLGEAGRTKERTGSGGRASVLKKSGRKRQEGSSRSKHRDVLRGSGSFQGVVKLNIGGTSFWTSEEVLTNHSSYFRSMFSGRFGYELQDDGSIFVDRDPLLFAPLLTFMREGELICPIGIPPTRLQEEAEYYGIALTSLQTAQLYCMGLGVDPTQSNLSLGARLVKMKFAKEFGQHGGHLLEMISTKFFEATESNVEPRLRIMEGESQYFRLLNSQTACETLKLFFEETADCCVEIRPTNNAELGLKYFDICLRHRVPRSFPLERFESLPL